MLADLGIPQRLAHSDPRLFATHTSNTVPALNTRQHRTAIRFSSPQLLLELRELLLLADQAFSVKVRVPLCMRASVKWTKFNVIGWMLLSSMGCGFAQKQAREKDFGTHSALRLASRSTGDEVPLVPIPTGGQWQAHVRTQVREGIAARQLREDGRAGSSQTCRVCDPPFGSRLRREHPPDLLKI